MLGPTSAEVELFELERVLDGVLKTFEASVALASLSRERLPGFVGSTAGGKFSVSVAADGCWNESDTTPGRLSRRDGLGLTRGDGVEGEGMEVGERDPPNSISATGEDARSAILCSNAGGCPML